ncbi:MAG: ferrochelatase [Gammaproteobacteria bacterium]|nr:ferrochelatase [Gammaproteobacteria bacterium]
MTKKGVLLINLGTPDSPAPKSVYRYLRQFLNDPRVIDLPKLWRAILTNIFIVPFRYKKSAEAYRKIWGQDGSPLLTNSQKLVEGLTQQLGPDYQVELAMRYGSPNIHSVLKTMQACDKIIAIPLFPQYSSAATGSAIENLMRSLSQQWNIPHLVIKKDFYDDPGFITAYAEVIHAQIASQKADHIIFSYHGLPQRHINKSDCKANCDGIKACPPINRDNAFCYRAQCYATTELIAKKLQLQPEQYTVAFQSRIGRTPWIKPYTDRILPELRKKGVKNIAIVCPSFVADCLETLEEINIRAREDWAKLGGEQFIFIPCINYNPTWVKALGEMVHRYA